MADSDRSAGKKHCFTRGLIDRLRARAGIVHRPGRSSPLPIFIWESPPLAKSYRITFLARLEPDGEEGLGFRFDDTSPGAPSQLVWGGTVGRVDSPRCFLDGSQTFITESVSKASERCRRGWHVRIGKVSQIVKAFEDGEDSLVMKLSLRKIDSNTKITRLTSQASIPSPPPYPSLDFQYPTYNSKPHAPRPDPPALRQCPQRLHEGTNALVSNADNLTPPATPKINLSAETNSVIESVSPLLSSPLPDTDTADGSPCPPASVADDISDLRLPVNDEETPVVPAEETGVALSADENQSKDSESAPANPEPESISSSSASEVDPCGSLLGAHDSEPKPAEASPTSPEEFVCFLFPSTRTCLDAKKLYVACDLLKNVDYFRQVALEAPTSKFSIGGPRASSFPSGRALRTNCFHLFILLLSPLKTRLLRCRDSLCRRFPSEVQKVEGVATRILPVFFRIGWGMSGLFVKTCYRAIEMVLHESVGFLHSFNPNDETTQATIGSRLPQSLSLRLLRLLEASLFKWRYLETATSILGSESDDAMEEDLQSVWLGETGFEQPPSSALRATYTVHDTPYSTFCGMLQYLQHRAIKFAPLRSCFETRTTLARELSKGDLAIEVMREFPLNYQDYLKSHLVVVPQDEQDQVSEDVGRNLAPCCPKSTYKLATELKISSLKEIAHRQIMSSLSPLNIAFELQLAQFRNDTYWSEVRDSYYEKTKCILGLVD